jgi:hypothetical protein
MACKANPALQAISKRFVPRAVKASLRRGAAWTEFAPASSLSRLAVAKVKTLS